MIVRQNLDRFIRILGPKPLDGEFKSLMSEADAAWGANLKAIKLIDHQNDAVKGEDEIENLLIGLSAWEFELENLEHAAKRIAKWASQTVHAGGSNVPTEEDGSEYRAHQEGDSGYHDSQGSSRASEKRGRSGRNRRRHRASGFGGSGMGAGESERGFGSFEEG